MRFPLPMRLLRCFWVWITLSNLQLRVRGVASGKEYDRAWSRALAVTVPLQLS
jgi:hypothetical protein